MRRLIPLVIVLFAFGGCKCPVCPADMARPADLSMPPDLAGPPDMVAPADMTVTPDCKPHLGYCNKAGDVCCPGLTCVGGLCALVPAR